MHPLSASKVEQVLSLIDSGHSSHQISALTAIITPLSLAYGLNTVLMFLSPVVDVHPSFLTLISTMLVISLTLAKLTTHPKSPECSETSTTQASQLRLYVRDSRRLVGKQW